MKELIKIVIQAVNNGFDLQSFCLNHDIPLFGMYSGILQYMLNRKIIDLLLLNKEFNKAFWGKREIFIKYINDDEYNIVENEGWEYHLQRTVLEDNKIEYFKKGLVNA